MFLLLNEFMGASENMAFDSVFLASASFGSAPRLRFYGWAEESYTCGVSHKASDFFGILPSGTPVVRRPTGGGLVFHKHTDITYALVVPSSHELFCMRPRDSYVAVHKEIAGCLKIAGFDASIFLGAGGSVSQCFDAPVYGDVVSASLDKFAGAAQKRTRGGFLMQGSIKLPGNADAKSFKSSLAVSFAALLGEDVSPVRRSPSDEPFWAETLRRFASDFVP